MRSFPASISRNRVFVYIDENDISSFVLPFLNLHPLSFGVRYRAHNTRLNARFQLRNYPVSTYIIYLGINHILYIYHFVYI